MDFREIQQLSQKLKDNVQKVIVGRDETIDHMMIALIASGHILLEDYPGMGKTLLAKSMARSLDMDFRRIQFTPDLLPTDISGLNYYNQKEGEFQFRPGPIFTNILLADEINRATPRTQSSLLECMEERQVTIDGETRMLEKPFLVIATQNPVETQGTFPLPEAQLDRFLIKTRMGYPTTGEGLEVLKRFKSRQPLEEIGKIASRNEILEAQRSYSDTYVSDDILSYIMDIVERTRKHPDLILGVSPRGSQALLKCVQVYAILQGRSYVIPDDVKAMVKPVLAHRIILKLTSRIRENQGEQVLDQIIRDTPVPAEENLMKKGNDN
ncbi:MAG: AAA family ATPase [Caldicoprobacterales bacterium]|jgi:MoxR-like ATPase|nr:MoxR family ATPase [Clostridiales bacterium]